MHRLPPMLPSKLPSLHPHDPSSAWLHEKDDRLMYTCTWGYMLSWVCIAYIDLSWPDAQAGLYAAWQSFILASTSHHDRLLGPSEGQLPAHVYVWALSEAEIFQTQDRHTQACAAFLECYRHSLVAASHYLPGHHSSMVTDPSCMICMRHRDNSEAPILGPFQPC